MGRTRELGIRLALGASPGTLVRHVLSRGLAPAIAGGSLGLGMAVALARAFRALLFGIEPIDASSFLAGGVTLLLVALAAALGPARRASRVEPVNALRNE